MSLATIITTLQMALALLSAISATPNLSESLRATASDIANQAIEMAVSGLAEASAPKAVNEIAPQGRFSKLISSRL